MVGGAESSSCPGSGAALGYHLAPAALPRLTAVVLVPMIFSSAIGEGLSPARSQPSLPPVVPRAVPREGGVLAIAGTEPATPRPGRSSASHSDPRRPLRALRPPALPVLQPESFPHTPCSWGAPGHRNHAFLGPCSSLHHVLEPCAPQPGPCPLLSHRGHSVGTVRHRHSLSLSLFPRMSISVTE